MTKTFNLLKAGCPFSFHIFLSKTILAPSHSFFTPDLANTVI